jgi:hypothetical protein
MGEFKAFHGYREINQPLMGIRKKFNLNRRSFLQSGNNCREGIMSAISFVQGFSPVEIVIIGFIAMNIGLSGFYFLHRGVKKVTAKTE